MKTLYIGAICCLAIVASVARSPAQSAPAQIGSTARATPTATPMPIALPSLAMEGEGEIAPTSQSPCSGTTCTGTLTATLSGRPFGKAGLTLNLSAGTATDSFTNCNQLVGSGTINGDAFSVFLVGEICRPNPGVGYLLSGTVQIFSASSPNEIAAAGSIAAFGGTNIPPHGPIPSSQSVVSIVGGTAKIPVLLP